MKKYFSTFFALFCFGLLMCCVGVSAVSSDSSVSVYSDVLRLHIVANSDSHQDQSIKYKVRDGIAALTKDMFGSCKSAQEALLVANENKALLESAAREILKENQSGESVNVEIGMAHYTEKTLNGIVFPEGEYLSVRVILGKGEGQNWWCVLFPSLCDVGIEQEGVTVSSGKTANKQTQKQTGGIEIFGCRVKLKILEYFE